MLCPFSAYVFCSDERPITGIAWPSLRVIGPCFFFFKTSCEQRAVNSESNGSDTRRLRHGVLFGALEWVWTDADNVDQSS